jgi:hypothetical protein
MRSDQGNGRQETATAAATDAENTVATPSPAAQAGIPSSAAVASAISAPLPANSTAAPAAGKAVGPPVAPVPAGPNAGPPYRGALGRTQRVPTHLSCRCGLAFVAQIYRSINLLTHSELREVCITGPLNAASCPRCGTRCQPVVPVLIHDEPARRFILLLDEPLLSREMEERASVYQALAKDTVHEIPAYVREFQVVLGRSGLAERLVGPSREARHRDVADRERELAARAQALATRERDLDARAESLAAREAELARKSREGWRRPAPGPAAAPSALAGGGTITDVTPPRMEVPPQLAQLAAPPSAVERARLRTPPGGRPAVDPAAGSSPPTTATSTESASATPLASIASAGSEATVVSPPPSAAAARDRTPVWSRAAAEMAAGLGASTPPSAESAATLVTSVAALDDGAAAGAPAPPAPAATTAPASAAAAAGETPAPVTPTPSAVTEVTAESPAATPPASTSPAPAERGNRALVGEQAVVRLRGAQLSVLDERLQLRPRMKLHLLPSYPVIELALHVEPVPGGESDTLPSPEPALAAFRWTFDGCDAGDRAFLDRLAEVFHLLVEVEGRPAPLALIAPLEENVRLVLERFESLRAQAPWQAEPTAPLFAVALHELAAPGYDASPPTLGDDPFPLIPSPSVARLALETVAYWADRGRQDDLLLRGGYPVVTFRRLLARALARAIDFGLVLPAALEEQAHKLGLTTTRPELLRRQLQAFVAVASHKVPNDLGPGEEWENWSRLLRACETAGVNIPEQARQLARTAARRIDDVTGPQGTLDEALLQGASPATLLALLTRREARADAVRMLALRGDPGHLEVLFRVVRQLSRSETARVVPSLARYGAAAERHLVEALRSRKAHVRLGCALLLSHIAGRRSLSPLVDLLLDEETEAWVKIADLVADFGAEALAPLSGAARRAVGSPGRVERVARALALLGTRGQEAAVTRLAQDKEPHTQEAAQLALVQLAELQAGRTPATTPAPHTGEGPVPAVAGMLEKQEWDLFTSRVTAGLLALRRGEPPPAAPEPGPGDSDDDDGELVVEGDDILEAEDLLIEPADVFEGVPVPDDAIVEEQPSGLHVRPTRPAE